MTPKILQLATFLAAHPEYDGVAPEPLAAQLNTIDRPGDVPTNEIDRFMSTNFLNYFVDAMFEDPNTPDNLKAILWEIRNFRNAKWQNVQYSTYQGLLATMDYFPFLTDAHKAGLTALCQNRRSILGEAGIESVSYMDVILARQYNAEAVS